MGRCPPPVIASGEADARIRRSARHLGVTGWEIGLLVAKRRLTLTPDPLTWIMQTLARTRVEVIPLPLEPAVRSAEFQQLRDPADQLIVATALHFGAPLVTKDRRIRGANIVETIW